MRINAALSIFTITGCRQPVVLDPLGSDTPLFCDKFMECVGTTNTTQTVVVTGRFKLIGNPIAGLDGMEATAEAAR